MTCDISQMAVSVREAAAYQIVHLTKFSKCQGDLNIHISLSASWYSLSDLSITAIVPDMSLVCIWTIPNHYYILSDTNLMSLVGKLNHDVVLYVAPVSSDSPSVHFIKRQKWKGKDTFIDQRSTTQKHITNLFSTMHGESISCARKVVPVLTPHIQPGSHARSRIFSIWFSKLFTLT